MMIPAVGSFERGRGRTTLISRRYSGRLFTLIRNSFAAEFISDRGAGTSFSGMVRGIAFVVIVKESILRRTINTSVRPTMEACLVRCNYRELLMTRSS